MYDMPGVMWSVAAQIGNIQIQQNGQTTENQAQSLPQGSQSLSII